MLSYSILPILKIEEQKDMLKLLFYPIPQAHALVHLLSTNIEASQMLISSLSFSTLFIHGTSYLIIFSRVHEFVSNWLCSFSVCELCVPYIYTYIHMPFSCLPLCMLEIMDPLYVNLNVLLVYALQTLF